MDELTPTVVWISGESGDGKSTLSREMGLGLIFATDWFACASVDRWAETNPDLAKLWAYEDDFHAGSGWLRLGNLSIGGFWSKAVANGYTDFLADEFVTMFTVSFRSQFGRVAGIEGWVPDPVHEAIIDRLLRSGFRVWEMSRRKL